MSLTKLQKLGAFLAFIPGISTIVGAIKIYHYSNQIKKHDQLARDSLNVNAVTIHDKAQATFKARAYATAACYERKARIESVVTLVPVFNIGGALSSLSINRELSKIQDELDAFEGIDPFLLKHYKAPDDLDEAQQKTLLDAFKHLYVRLDLSDTSQVRLGQYDLDYAALRMKFAQTVAQDLIQEVKQGYKGSGEDLYIAKLTSLQGDARVKINDQNRSPVYGSIDGDPKWYSRALAREAEMIADGLKPAAELKKKESI